MSALVVYSPQYQLYNFGPRHPFSPVRLEMLVDLLQHLGHPLHFVEPTQATREEVRSVHLESFVRRVEAAGRGEHFPDFVHYGIGTADTPHLSGYG
jgi:acetoin utilization protein AcuC